MFNWLFGKKQKGRLGIDLGTSAIKIVELTEKDERLHLNNYAWLQFKDDSVFKFSDLNEEEVAKAIIRLIDEAKIENRRANISLPIGKTFSTIIDLPMMSKEELEAAIPFEAKKYVPVPLEEVVLDWSVVGEVKEGRKNINGNNTDIKAAPVIKNDQSASTRLQVLLVAVPKEVINQITRIAKIANLEIASLEQEAFSLARSLVGNDQGTFLIIDIGRRSSDIMVIDEGFVRLSHNLESVTKEMLLMEVDRLVNVFQIRYNKNIKQCLLVGGRAKEKELSDFLGSKLKIGLKVGDPFARVVRAPALEKILPDVSFKLAVAVGLAMRE